MPGMVIGHYHATYEGIGLGSPPVGMEAAPALQTIRAVRNLEKALMAGFTSVIAPGRHTASTRRASARSTKGSYRGRASWLEAAM